VTTGASFAPVIVVEGAPKILWEWSDGTTSDSTAPSVNFGTEESREQRLRVTPWSALRRINIGYDGGDGGSGQIEYVADQHVAEVRNLDLVAPSLREWCSSYNKIVSLDFSNFVNLSTIECYYSSLLKSVKLSNTPNLGRACFEGCALESLDLSGCPRLADLRGAKNRFPTITFADSMPEIWHLCINDNTMTARDLFKSTDRFPNIRELFIWKCNQTGALRIPSTARWPDWVAIFAYSNQYTSVDLSGDDVSEVDLHSNSVDSISIDGCRQLIRLKLADNALAANAVTYVLTTLDGLGRTNGTVDLSGGTNAVPSGQAATDAIVNLRAKGWTVTVNQ